MRADTTPGEGAPGDGAGTGGAGVAAPRWLAIAEEPFLPPDAGGRVETLNFLLAAHQAGIDLRVLVPTREQLDTDRYAEVLPGVSIVGLPRDSSPLAHLSRMPYVQSSRPTEPLQRALEVTPPLVDAVISYSTRVAHMGETIAKAWSVPHLVRAHNVESEYFRVLAQRSGGPRAAAYRLEYMKFRRAEAAMHRSPHVTVIADISREDHTWRAQRSTVRTIHLPPFLPRTARPGAGAPRRAPVAGRVLFAGSLDTATNTEALRWFLSTAWPSLLRLRPGVTLSVVGRRATPALLAELRSHERVTVHIDVPDMAPYLAEAMVSINPIRSGSGVNIKVIGAMEAEVPVVSTTVGSRGMDWVPGRDLLVEDDPESFARAIARLLDDPEGAERIGRSGGDYVRHELDWSRLIDRLRVELHGSAPPIGPVEPPAGAGPGTAAAEENGIAPAGTEPDIEAEAEPDIEAEAEPDIEVEAEGPRVRGPFEPRTPIG